MTPDSDPLAQKDQHGKQLGNTKDQYLNIENLIEGRLFQMFLRICQKNRFLWFNCGLTVVYCFSSCTRNVSLNLSESQPSACFMFSSVSRWLAYANASAIEMLKHVDKNLCFNTCFNKLKQPVSSYDHVAIYCIVCIVACTVKWAAFMRSSWISTEQSRMTKVNDKSDKSDIELSRIVQIA
jgi:hypothetical protein